MEILQPPLCMLLRTFKKRKAEQNFDFSLLLVTFLNCICVENVSMVNNQNSLYQFVYLLNHCFGTNISMYMCIDNYLFIQKTKWQNKEGTEKDKERERPSICWFIPHMVNSLAWARLKPGIRNSVLAFHIWWSGAQLETSVAAFPGTSAGSCSGSRAAGTHTGVQYGLAVSRAPAASHCQVPQCVFKENLSFQLSLYVFVVFIYLVNRKSQMLY